MAKTTLQSTSFLLFTILLVLHSFEASGLGGSIVGGRTKVKNVERNQQVQELGRYCVEEYNHENGGKWLSFSQVLEAETQVVSGIKYYLKISAVNRDGLPENFDAIVVVKAWEKSRQMLNFSPSHPTK